MFTPIAYRLDDPKECKELFKVLNTNEYEENKKTKPI